MCSARTSTLAFDVLADILTDSQFDAEELEREKNVIMQEIGAVEDTPDDLVFDLVTAAAWPDQPLGRPILGTRESVGAFDPAAIDGYLGRHYRAGADAGRRRRRGRARSIRRARRREALPASPPTLDAPPRARRAIAAARR